MELFITKMMQMRKFSLLFLFLTSCALPNKWHYAHTPGYDGRYDGKWYTAYGVHHALITVGATQFCDIAGVKKSYCEILMCGLYFGHEMEETRNFTIFEWGFLDSFGDVVSPCLVLPIHILIKREN